MAAAGEIPGARRTVTKAHWVFELNHELEAWICFQRIRKQSGADGIPKQRLVSLGRDWRRLLGIYDRLLSISRSGTETRLFTPEQDESTRWKKIEELLTTQGALPPQLEEIIFHFGATGSKPALRSLDRPEKISLSRIPDSAHHTALSSKKGGVPSRKNESFSAATRLNKRQKTPCVALNINELTNYGRPIVNGILSYLRKNPRWNIPIVNNRAFLTINQLTKWKGDGIIGEFYGYSAAEKIARLGIPAVNLSGYPANSSFPSIFSFPLPDNTAVGTLAADHLIKLHRPVFLFFGDQCEYSKIRYHAFEKRIVESGGTAEHYRVLEHSSQGDVTDSSLYLSVLKKYTEPVSIFAATDRIALGVLLACNKLKRKVPEDVAILGCDNEEIICQISDPGISSIDWDPFRIGYIAAEYLDNIMRGRPTQDTTTPQPQMKVVLRGSSDAYATVDKDLASAMQFIREHASEPIYVPDVVKACGISRRKLEALFSKYLQRGIYEEIRAIHIASAEQLLVNTQLSLAEIARQSGFNSVAALEGAFKQKHGCYARPFRLRNTQA